MSKETLHDIDFTFVEPGVGGMEMPMDSTLDYDEKLQLAHDQIAAAYPDYEDVHIVKIVDSGIGEE